jgi:hypothetical protein
MTAPRTKRVAHLAVHDGECRARIRDVLARQDWDVVEHPTGFHLLQAIADLIDGYPAEMPGLLVLDSRAHGCSGITIAVGLRELGVTIPLVLITRPGDPLPVSDELAFRVAGPTHVVADVAEVVRSIGSEPRGAPAGLPTQSSLSQ